MLEASLGYFINPLMSVLLGVVVLRERLRLVPMMTVLIAVCGVLVLALDVGSVPWVALYLAGSFALYGLFRKTSPAGSWDGLTIEMLVLLPFVLSLLVVRALSGDGVFGLSDIGLDVWLIGAGAMTIAPLLLFSASARAHRTLDRRDAPVPGTDNPVPSGRVVVERALGWRAGAGIRVDLVRSGRVCCRHRSPDPSCPPIREPCRRVTATTPDPGAD